LQVPDSPRDIGVDVHVLLQLLPLRDERLQTDRRDAPGDREHIAEQSEPQQREDAQHPGVLRAGARETRGTQSADPFARRTGQAGVPSGKPVRDRPDHASGPSPERRGPGKEELITRQTPRTRCSDVPVARREVHLGLQDWH